MITLLLTLADAGPNQRAASGTIVTLDGTGSHDLDGDKIVKYFRFPQLLLSQPPIQQGSTTANEGFNTRGSVNSLVHTARTRMPLNKNTVQTISVSKV
jgi:hypothetical protein